MLAGAEGILGAFAGKVAYLTVFSVILSLKELIFHSANAGVEKQSAVRNTLRGFDQDRGAPSDAGSSLIFLVQTAPLPLFRVSPRYFSVPSMASSLAAMRIA